jgi:hypothetical protein
MKAITLFILMALMFSCKASKVSQEPAGALAPVMVYKTKADYSQLVPVTLNETGDKIVSYPAPSDLYTRGILAVPVQLNKGYLLDVRGIQPHSAFTSYTYEAYSQLESAPSVQELIDSIVDPDPFVELYDCGNRSQYKSLEKDLNKLIRKKFKGTRSLMK